LSGPHSPLRELAGKRRRPVGGGCAGKAAFVLAAAIVIAASPALAQFSHKAKAQRSLQVQSYGGYGGQKRYTDPDPNVRFELMRQENWRKGG
jgi:hypothetical protein